ncbi:AraC family transcriptional regulator [Flavobacterium sp. NRK F10]|uniref:AraC family transcriptional regulator n=1 Tax=Flavobacterium sp. NRK F10 TaxID=2954931 RepID=UPI0020917488|nr:AraC family transcriptional regulator [Flavobacterium sp. NRK F10]MCO6175955.1 AraC family transcriptional regulator [Flavobacterium sp. NRK F10]
MNITDKIYQNRKLETWVENKTSHTLNSAEMHIFETHQTEKNFLLKFRHPVLATMFEGKKVMHLRGMDSFDFLPGESLILPANELMTVDFPEASLDTPTKCLAMTISEEMIRKTIDDMNERRAKIDGEWEFKDYNFHFTNDMAIQQIIERLLFLFTENHRSKDIFADFMLRELVIRILQAETRSQLVNDSKSLAINNRLAFIVDYIRQNLDKNLTIKELSNKAYMSESHFYRVFKNELNLSPIDFINNERIKLATELLRDPKKQIKEIYMECGFNSPSYFNRIFKRVELISPSEYKMRFMKE